MVTGYLRFDVFWTLLSGYERVGSCLICFQGTKYHGPGIPRPTYTYFLLVRSICIETTISDMGPMARLPASDWTPSELLNNLRDRR